MSEWKWVPIDRVLPAHAEQLARFGGPAGIRDRGALESALARPENLAVYGDPDLAALAASYAFGLARNHAFVDGNKRIAWLTARFFLARNEGDLRFDPEDAYRMVMSLAAGELSEDMVANWFRERLR
jgi:death-on-curing protein